MKPFTRFLLAVIAMCPMGVMAAPVPTTVGSNLTAYNPGSGALNNNTWATSTNSRSTSGGAAAPSADFGNCNSLILRCAQPKCAGGGCSDMTVASTIVNGCVQSSDACKKHGTDLVNYIAAQLVADSAAAANTAAANAASAANAAASQQMAAMQQQMQQMQADMAAQNAAQMQQMQAALDEQKQIAAAAQAQAAANATAAAQTTATSSGTQLSDAQMAAAAAGVSQDLLVREQIGGEIMTKIENAEKQLKALEVTMKGVFEYAGCDGMGNNCEGPKRISKFKDLAKEFFTPYENVTDEIYDALIDAMSIGVDITDVMMLLNNSCNRWGEYWCKLGQNPTYTEATCRDGRSVGSDETHAKYGKYRDGPFDGQPCKPGAMIPESNNGCRLIKLFPADQDVAREMLWGEEDPGESGSSMRVACATDVLFSSSLFSKKAKPAAIDIDTLQRMITQEEGRVSRNNRKGNTEEASAYKYCVLDDDEYTRLYEFTSRRTLPNKKLCVSQSWIDNNVKTVTPVIDTMAGVSAEYAREKCVTTTYNGIFSAVTNKCYCEPKYSDAANKIKLRWDVSLMGNDKSVPETIKHTDGTKLTSEEQQQVDARAKMPIVCDEAKTIKLFQTSHQSHCQDKYGDAVWTPEAGLRSYADTTKTHFGTCNCTARNNNAKDIANCQDAFENGYTITDGAGGGQDKAGAPRTVTSTSSDFDQSLGETDCNKAGWHYDQASKQCVMDDVTTTTANTNGTALDFGKFVTSTFGNVEASGGNSVQNLKFKQLEYKFEKQ